MSGEPNTVFLRLEGPMQVWGDNSKFVIRRSMEAPTKSGITGLICCAMGLSRVDAHNQLPELNALTMGVRIDRAGEPWWDYHTVGARYGVLTAEGKVKRTASTGEIETLVTRREYLSDASFLVALQGSPLVIERVAGALARPKWPLFLGRKACPPAVPILVMHNAGGVQAPLLDYYSDILSAFRSAAVPWRPRFRFEWSGKDQISLQCLIEWKSSEETRDAPLSAETWFDVPVSFEPPVHIPRLVTRETVTVNVGEPTQQSIPAPPRMKADYRDAEWRRRREKRLDHDNHLCVFCKSPAGTVHHVTYRHGGGNERNAELRSLCRLCHDAVTMIEYGENMGLDRIDPKNPEWREKIIQARSDIIKFRSLQTRRKYFKYEEED